MTQVLSEPVTARPTEPARWRRLVPFGVVLLAVLLVGGWSFVAQHPQLGSGGYGAFMDARPLEDGLGTTRYVLPVGDGERVVLTSIRNDGPLPLTVRGSDGTGVLSWVSVTFRDVGPAPRQIGYPSTSAARADVTRTSLRLEPGDSADVLVAFDRPAEVSVAEGTTTEVLDLPLTVRYLGLESTRTVPLMHEPLTLVGPRTFARLEQEGRFAATP